MKIHVPWKRILNPLSAQKQGKKSTARSEIYRTYRNPHETDAEWRERVAKPRKERKEA